MDKISIAMATFNGARYIGEQLRSLADQTLLPAELVVTDDGSTDNTVEIVSAFAATAPFPVRVHVNPQRLGYGANFMGCAARCEGDLIAFCDQDDIWSPDKLAACAALFTPEVRLVYHNADVFEGDRVLRPLYPPSQRASRRPFGLSPWFVAYGFTIVFRRELLALGRVWEGALGYDEDQRLAHDQWISLVGNICGPVPYVGRPLARYRLHDSNVTLRHRSVLDDLRANIGQSRTRAERAAAVLGSVDALIRAELRSGRAPAALAPPLAAAAAELAETGSWMRRRAALYGRTGLVRNASTVARLLTAGAYGARRTGGLGGKVFLKDLVVGCLAGLLLPTGG
ncbi:glycosyltransferase [Lichenibacterium dinghuense]|uniref:glycosyltransferase n=1 Tax=Lichenibacterium dinghuense TaxID=2895977 RepID=UPI001F40C678|nr:glycosyltransferase [Lichenibacterium sp. 6Y81]